MQQQHTCISIYRCMCVWAKENNNQNSSNNNNRDDRVNEAWHKIQMGIACGTQRMKSCTQSPSKLTAPRCGSLHVCVCVCLYKLQIMHIIAESFLRLECAIILKFAHKLIDKLLLLLLLLQLPFAVLHLPFLGHFLLALIVLWLLFCVLWNVDSNLSI